jgi:abortive infection bacteriophage resistance protein
LTKGPRKKNQEKNQTEIIIIIIIIIIIKTTNIWSIKLKSIKTLIKEKRKKINIKIEGFNWKKLYIYNWRIKLKEIKL